MKSAEEHMKAQAPRWGKGFSRARRDWLLVGSQLKGIFKRSWERRSRRFAMQRRNVEGVMDILILRGGKERNDDSK